MFHKQLQTFPIRTLARRRAFSLAELIVSMGILLLMLTLAGQVMNLTVRATGQAKALTDVNRALRIFEQTLREDLRHVHRGDSIMVIQGNPINAYWTQTGKETDDNGDPADGYPHVRDPEREIADSEGIMIKPRADLLMFFTIRQARNYVQYDYAGVGGSGQAVTSGIQQIVYGHANSIEYGPEGCHVSWDDMATFPDDPATYWPVPAEQWHLARRVVHLLDLNDPPPPSEPPWACVDGCLPESDPDYQDGDPDRDLLGNRAFRLGMTDVMTGFDYNWWVRQPLEPDDNLDIDDYPLYWPPVLDVPDREFVPFARSVLDPTPPPRLADRLGHYFLPNCASFKVEWALDPNATFVDGRLDGQKQLYWVDPGMEDPLDSTRKEAANTGSEELDELLADQLLGDTLVPGGGGPNVEQHYSLSERFGGGDFLEPDWHGHGLTDGTRANLVVFAASRRRAAPFNPLVAGDPMPEDIFPVALRITVDLFDEERRLERPVRHVIVVPVGR